MGNQGVEGSAHHHDFLGLRFDKTYKERQRQRDETILCYGVSAILLLGILWPV